MSFARNHHPRPAVEQWERVIRWRERLDELERTNPASDEAMDTALALFTCLHHMRDWVLATDAGQRADVDRLIARSRSLQLVRDLANGAKHWEITRASVDAGHMTMREYDPPPRRDERTVPFRLVVCAAGRKLDLLALADSAVEEWATFMNSSGLLDAA